MKQYSAAQLITTAGAGVAIGTNISLFGAYRDNGATTITIKAGAVTILSLSANQTCFLPVPAAISGPVTCTSSGGNAHVLFRQA